ncbi:MAG: MoxR family ATPase [Planctomycetota bacterium]|nr:MoxR family ATPase [Planctomycetota bacterium]
MTTPTRQSLDESRALAAHVASTGERLRAQAARRIIGLDDVVEQVLITVLTRNHALLEGVPGLAKTLLLSTVAELLDLKFSRIQFTPDLMPSDITGSEYLVPDTETGERHFRFAQGPAFANLVLADEINRAPPKTQAALMEAMEERQVTSLGVSRPLDDPFIVLATQNPIEQEGTYPLPMAQYDRFLFKILLEYPSYEQEARIARLTALGRQGPLDPIVSRSDFVEIANAVAHVDVPAPLTRYAVELVQASRPDSPNAPGSVREYVEWGAGPRAAQALINGARARALLRGRSVPDADDVRALAPAVLRHRMVLGYAAEADALSTDRVVADLLEQVPCPGRRAGPARRGWLRRVFEAVWYGNERRRSA